MQKSDDHLRQAIPDFNLYAIIETLLKYTHSIRNVWTWLCLVGLRVFLFSLICFLKLLILFTQDIKWTSVAKWPAVTGTIFVITGDRDEAFSRRGLRCRRQPHLLQGEHRDVARRRQEDMRCSLVQIEDGVRRLTPCLLSLFWIHRLFVCFLCTPPQKTWTVWMCKKLFLSWSCYLCVGVFN